jgi:hypothetical protein
MTTNDLFRAAMDAYDNEGRHSEGIMAVIRLVSSETSKAIEADIERYPLMQRVNDQIELRKLADQDADRMRTERDEARGELVRLKMIVNVQKAQIDELDAKRS